MRIVVYCIKNFVTIDYFCVLFVGDGVQDEPRHISQYRVGLESNKRERAGDVNSTELYKRGRLRFEYSTGVNINLQ
jgi:hypothetical protein